MPKQCWLCAEWVDDLIVTADPYDGEAVQVCADCFDTLVDRRHALEDSDYGLHHSEFGPQTEGDDNADS